MDETTSPEATNSLAAEIADVFGFDAYDTQADSSAEPATSPAPEVAAPAPVQATPVAEAAAAAIPAAVSPTQVEEIPATPVLVETPADAKAALELAELKARLAKLEPAAPPSADTVGQVAPTEEETLNAIKYEVQLPDAVLDGLFGESPEQAKQTMNALISSIITQSHRTAAKLVMESQTLLQAQIQAPIAEAENRKAEETSRQEYFKAFPAHENPAYQLLLGQQAAALAAEFPTLSWGKEMREALGMRVNAALIASGVTPVSGAALATASQPSAAPAPAPFSPAGRRAPAPATNSVDISAEIMDVFS
jgi:hypothetical protein